MLRIAPSEPRKRPYPEPRATNFARGSLASKFPCPWFGSNISGRPAKSERARDSGSALVDPGVPRPVDIDPAVAQTVRRSQGVAPRRPRRLGVSGNPTRELRILPRASPARQPECEPVQRMFPTNGDSRSLFPPMHPYQHFSPDRLRSDRACLRSFSLRTVERFRTAHKSIEPRAGEPDRGLLVTGTGGKN